LVRWKTLLKGSIRFFFLCYDIILVIVETSVDLKSDVYKLGVKELDFVKKVIKVRCGDLLD